MSLRQSAIDLIEQSGIQGYTSADLAVELDIAENYARVICSILHKRKQVYIAKYRRTEDDSRRLYPRPVYRFGNRPDVPRPPRLSKAEYKRRWRVAIRSQVTSVFDLGKPINGRRLAAPTI